MLVTFWALGCASPAPVTPAPCVPACAPGAACVLGVCYVAADGGSEAAVDASQGPDGGADATPSPDATGDASDGALDKAEVSGGCDPGLVDCDGNPANGCENIDTNLSHCGRCGAACPTRPNAARACRARVCDYVCSENFADCDRNAANGCEVDTRRDAMNCGACGTACPLTHVCNGGVCVNVTSPGCPVTCVLNADCAACMGDGPWCCVGGRCNTVSPRCP